MLAIHVRIVATDDQATGIKVFWSEVNIEMDKCWILYLCLFLIHL